MNLLLSRPTSHNSKSYIPSMIKNLPRGIKGASPYNITSRRFFFNKLKTYKKVSSQIKESTNDKKIFIPEYSITPDTYTYKVARDGEKESIIQGSEKNPIALLYKIGTEDSLAGETHSEFFNNHPTVTSEKLKRKTKRPTTCKMLTSEFIEDSLYNPNYGYFAKQVEIFHPNRPFDYNKINDIDDFMQHWSNSYDKYEKTSNPATEIKNPVNDAHTAAIKANISKATKPSLQLWHTPTELFQPYYGEALARYLLVNYKLNQYPYNDLIIYEMGGGNGTLMCNILNYIKLHQPEVYARTKYKIIEISSQLAEKQFSQAIRHKLIELGLDTNKVEIINKSIFDWDRKVPEPCFFIGLEVFDNFAHDSIRFDLQTGEPYQGYVVIDKHGDFREFYTSDLSSYTEYFLNLREHGRYPILHNNTISNKLTSVYKPNHIHPLQHPIHMSNMRNALWPFRSNLSSPEYIPTRLLQFFHILKSYFPEHQLLTSDFHELPNSIKGYNAPVVQTMLDDKMVTTSTYMVHQGYFDIMFPTNFVLMADLYRQVVGKIAKVSTHKDFLEQWGDVEATTTKKGDNPMLEFYSNASFMVS